jgi:hypothetical protein
MITFMRQDLKTLVYYRPATAATHQRIRKYLDECKERLTLTYCMWHKN